MKKSLKKLLMAACVVLLVIGFVKCDTTPVQAATKRLQGGHSKKTAKTVSKKTDYIVKLKGQQGLWYKFKTPNYSTYFSYNIKNLSVNGRVETYLYTKYDEELGYVSSNNGEDYTNGFEERLKPSTWYYIYVENIFSDASGYFRFSYKLQKDDIANTKGKAKSIKINKSYMNSIDGKCDEDWFKFKPTSSGTYTFCLKGMSDNVNVYGSVYSKYREELDYTYSYNTMNSFSIKLKKNQWYYINVYDNSYNYTPRKYRFSIS